MLGFKSAVTPSTFEPDPISEANIRTYYVQRDGYQPASAEFEVRLPAHGRWHQGGRFVPADLDDMAPDEELLWRSINVPDAHVTLVSGRPGAGKSHLLKRFVRRADRSKLSYALTAPTGIAAFNVGGETVHRCLGLGLADDPPTRLWARVIQRPRKYVKTLKFLQTTQLWICDEVSMLDPELFQKLDYLFRRARNSSAPFGSVRLLLVGDFTQLQPVNSDTLIMDTDVWSRMTVSRLFLDRSYRQAEGDPFLRLLNQVREGKIDEEGMAMLRSRIGVNIDRMQDGKKVEPVYLFPKRWAVEKHNKERLERLVADEKVELFRKNPTVFARKREHAARKDANEEKQANRIVGSKEARAKLARQFPVWSLNVAVGAQVMMRKNTYADEGIVNGSMGLVTDIGSNYISVLFLTTDGFKEAPINVEREEFSVRLGKTMEIVLLQYPLTLAWASTIHKCQGLTLDSMCLDGRDCFTAGQLFVALSRVRKLTDLTLIGLRESSLIADKRAVTFEARKEASTKAEAKPDQGPPDKRVKVSD